MQSGREDTRTEIIAAGRQLMARRGYTAVGIAEILAQAQVPKGSFYHYFTSKDAFGEAVMSDYFGTYLHDMDRISAHSEVTAAQRLIDYWQYWYEKETGDQYEIKCLAVKLGAEVADLSEPMRGSLENGTSAIIERISAMIDAGVADGSLRLTEESLPLARLLYDLWLGASVRAKIDRDNSPLDNAMVETRKLLNL